MILKSPISKNRVRKVPESFSWIDHRLVRDGYINKCSHSSSALYLFLACVSDSQGLSYYGDKSIMNILSMDHGELQSARNELILNNMLAWQKPVYQVLSLEPVKAVWQRTPGNPMSLGDILKKAAEAGND